MIERGVRYVQIYSGGMENQRSWDGHNDIKGNHSQFAGETDKPVAALITDLAKRGLLDETLIVWGGEFGRLPVAQKGSKPGRDHNPHAFTTWFTGGGIKGGVSYGETDEIGHKAAVNKVTVNDLHATILHLLGMDHERLTYRYNGRDFRLTDVAGNVIREIIALGLIRTRRLVPSICAWPSAWLPAFCSLPTAYRFSGAVEWWSTHL